MKTILGTFPIDYIPTVLDNSKLELNVEANDTLMKIEIWDTPGQEDYDRLRPLAFVKLIF